MHNALFVSMLERLPELREHSKSFLHRHWFALLTLEPIQQRAVGGILSHQVRAVFVDTDVNDGENVGMLEHFEQACFLKKEVLFFLRIKLCAVHNFDGHDAIFEKEMLTAVMEKPNQEPQRSRLQEMRQPSVRTFVGEKGKASWGIVWVQLIGLSIISAILIAMYYLIYPPHVGSVAGPGSGGLSSALLQLVVLLTVAIFTLILTPVSFFGAGGIIYLIAKVLGGTGTYLAQIYTTLLFGVPLVIVSYLLLLIPVAGS
jgi:hypothetical protein